MPRPRRRTLSHSEIENFLTEISQVSGENHVNKQAKQAGGDEFPTKHHYSHQYQHRDDDDLSQVNVLMDDDAPVDPIPLPPPTEADLIREYCKMQYRPTQWQAQVSSAITVQQRTVDISKSLHDVCKYKLVSSRLMFPENFPHPSTSIESKKSLLISLSPMLTEAEDQRKQDTKECEEYTRCRSSRGKGRSNYEYIDIDTSLRVEFAEFERRYMMFINRNKVCQAAAQDEEMEMEMVSAEELTDNMEMTIGSDQGTVHVVQSNHQTESVMTVQQDEGSVSSSSSSTQSLGEAEMDVVAMPESESDSLDLSLSLSFERKRSSHGDRKRKHNSAVDRRGTLSPASAKAMLFNAVEEEAVQAAHAGNIAPHQSFSQTPPTSPVRTESSPTSSSSSSSLPVSNLNNGNVTNVQSMVDYQELPAEDDFLGADNDLFADTASTSKSFGRASNRSHSHSSGSTGGHRYTQRRNTLSPSSAKSLALELIEKEEAEAEARMMAMSEQTKAIAGEASPHISSESESSASESEPESDLLAFQDDTDVDTECSSSTTEDSEMESEPESDTMIESERDSESVMDIAEESHHLIHCEDSKALVSEDDSVPVSQLDEILFSSSGNDTESEEPVHSNQKDIHNMMSGSVGQDRKHQKIAADITTVSAMNTDFEELLDEKAVLDALVPSSPTAAFSAFFGRKSEIAEILKIAMNIFEEDEHELTAFEKIENLVVESTSAKQTSVLPAGSINKSTMPVNMYNMEDIPAEMDTDALEAAANRRMKERIVIARNRYLWEVVSAQAANAAIRRMKSKKHPQI